jgi:hypothetical protein
MCIRKNKKYAEYVLAVRKLKEIQSASIEVLEQNVHLDPRAYNECDEHVQAILLQLPRLLESARNSYVSRGNPHNALTKVLPTASKLLCRMALKIVSSKVAVFERHLPAIMGSEQFIDYEKKLELLKSLVITGSETVKQAESLIHELTELWLLGIGVPDISLRGRRQLHRLPVVCQSTQNVCVP